MGLVFLLTTAVFWCAANGPYQPTFKDLQTYKSVSYCFYNAWAIGMGVSVTQLPTTSKLRPFFLIYVCYCFAMSTVFQAFFVSYLVEPKYEKKIESFDELFHSDIIYGYQQFTDFLVHTGMFPELIKFHETKSLREDCTDVRKCVEQLITKQDIATLADPMYSAYIASKMGIADPQSVICSLEQYIFSAHLITLFKKGNPYVDTFNVLMRRFLEAGFLERHWSELKYLACLKSADKLQEKRNNMFVSFSVSHLAPAFVVLVLGNTLSSVVFITELIHNWYCKRMK
jgi:hypothetical protein